MGTPRLIHVSHLNATADSASEFYRSKFQGEQAVRSAFPEATIVRPAGLYGAEDWLLNAAARKSRREPIRTVLRPLQATPSCSS